MVNTFFYLPEISMSNHSKLVGFFILVLALALLSIFHERFGINTLHEWGGAVSGFASICISVLAYRVSVNLLKVNTLNREDSVKARIGDVASSYAEKLTDTLLRDDVNRAYEYLITYTQIINLITKDKDMEQFSRCYLWGLLPALYWTEIRDMDLITASIFKEENGDIKKLLQDRMCEIKCKYHGAVTHFLGK